MRRGPHHIGTTGATAGDGLVFDPEDDEVVYGPVVQGLTSADSSVTIADNGDGTLDLAAAGGGGGSLTVQDENGNVATGVSQIDFQGAGVTAAAGTGEVVVTIPGGGGGGGSSNYPPGSADKPPTTPNARDDEFDGTSSVVWNATPTAPNATDVNTTRASHLYVKANGSGGAFVGRYQSAPTSYPFTIKTKTTSTARANYHKAGGIILLPTTPTSTSGVVYVGPQCNNGFNWGRAYYTSMGATFVSQSATFPVLEFGGSRYTKVVVNSATSISCYGSTDGFGWVLIETYTTPFSIANIGLAVTEELASGTPGSVVESFFDFFRVS